MNSNSNSKSQWVIQGKGCFEIPIGKESAFKAFELEFGLEFIGIWDLEVGISRDAAFLWSTA
jgi:hypothetical protein